MRHWTLQGPKRSWFTMDQLVAYLGISESTIRRLILDGRFPQGVKASPGAPPRWSGLDVAAYLYLCSRTGDDDDTENSSEDGNPKKKS